MVGFEVLTAVSTKMAVSWVLAPCCMVEVYQTARRYNQEDSHLRDFYGSISSDFVQILY
jgi:hypothetical protein